MPILFLSTMPSVAAANAPTPVLQLTLKGQMSSSLFPKETVSLPPGYIPPGYKAILGIDVYHISTMTVPTMTTMPFSCDLLMVYAWICQPSQILIGQVVPLSVYVDNEMMYNLLSQEFQGQVPVFLVKDVKVRINERRGDINHVTTTLMTKKFQANLNSVSIRSKYPGETLSMPTPAGDLIEIIAAPGNWAFTVGYATGYKSVCGIGFNTDLTMNIYKLSS